MSTDINFVYGKGGRASIVFLRGETYAPLKDGYDHYTDLEMNKETSDRILEFIESNGYYLAHGDIVTLIWNLTSDEQPNARYVYRNDGKYIYNKDRGVIEDLYYDADEYGSVPPHFAIGDRFDADHWIEVVAHNSIVWVPPQYVPQLINNATATGSFFVTGEGKRFDMINEDTTGNYGEERFTDVLVVVDALRSRISDDGYLLISNSYELQDNIERNHSLAIKRQIFLDQYYDDWFSRYLEDRRRTQEYMASRSL